MATNFVPCCSKSTENPENESTSDGNKDFHLMDKVHAYVETQVYYHLDNIIFFIH